jgi:hypothetical protein
MGIHLGWISGGGGDWRVARDSGRIALVFGDGTGFDQRLPGLTKTTSSFPSMSLSFSW